jgi:hypothetical protein
MGSDEANLEVVAELLTDDVTLEVPGQGIAFGPGRDEILEYKKRAAAARESRGESGRHLITNVHIDWERDGSAIAHSYVTFMLTTADGTTGVHGFASYEDRLVQVAGAAYRDATSHIRRGPTQHRHRSLSPRTSEPTALANRLRCRTTDGCSALPDPRSARSAVRGGPGAWVRRTRIVPVVGGLGESCKVSFRAESRSQSVAPHAQERWAGLADRTDAQQRCVCSICCGRSPGVWSVPSLSAGAAGRRSHELLCSASC